MCMGFRFLIVLCVRNTMNNSVHFGRSQKNFADEIIFLQHAKNKLNDKAPAIAKRKVPHMDSRRISLSGFQWWPRRRNFYCTYFRANYFSCTSKIELPYYLVIGKTLRTRQRITKRFGIEFETEYRLKKTKDCAHFTKKLHFGPAEPQKFKSHCNLGRNLALK